MKILVTNLELPAKQHCQSSPFTSKLFQIGQIRSSKRAPRILIFSIAMGANISFCVNFITTRAPTFFEYIISVLAVLLRIPRKYQGKRQNFKPIKSTIQIRTDFHENEAKNFFSEEKIFKIAVFQNRQFSKFFCENFTDRSLG